MIIQCPSTCSQSCVNSNSTGCTDPCKTLQCSCIKLSNTLERSKSFKQRLSCFFCFLFFLFPAGSPICGSSSSLASSYFSSSSSMFKFSNYCRYDVSNSFFLVSYSSGHLPYFLRSAIRCFSRMISA